MRVHQRQSRAARSSAATIPSGAVASNYATSATVDRMFPRDAVTHDMCSAGEEEESPCSHVALGGVEAFTVIYDSKIRAEWSDRAA